MNSAKIKQGQKGSLYNGPLGILQDEFGRNNSSRKVSHLIVDHLKRRLDMLELINKLEHKSALIMQISSPVHGSLVIRFVDDKIIELQLPLLICPLKTRHHRLKLYPTSCRYGPHSLYNYTK
ncbi:hypothetical protein Nepgr_023495 [Nepenthes gracilis]|uniref:Uncharacterized protein n=1 Tax=Nepenthes gracilis TaxID=150966 RepID=A0AAD3T253_NEPGR|nr:hypothetical protein Nepgr_023495 [Nepenthes gracilis]